MMPPGGWLAEYSQARTAVKRILKLVERMFLLVSECKIKNKERRLVVI